MALRACCFAGRRADLRPLRTPTLACASNRSRSWGPSRPRKSTGKFPGAPSSHVWTTSGRSRHAPGPSRVAKAHSRRACPGCLGSAPRCRNRPSPRLNAPDAPAVPSQDSQPASASNDHKYGCGRSWAIGQGAIKVNMRCSTSIPAKPKGSWPQGCRHCRRR